MKIGRFQVTAKASRFPWQAGYNWHGMTGSGAPLNQPRRGDKAAPRFGGGWKYKVGLAFSGQTLMLDLLFGIVTVRFFDWQEEERMNAERKARIDAILRRSA
ncbi:hypothetical protein [Paracoccus homiensis]|uniref:Uncharacterized protein n=1 Tax=Paracoccus homiensis TaxID=364199 RepID=A0A1I0GZR1_9RHOB|nr:hypothetical protein [Paracoccus homiensis]SET76008.1 hypothetical protein SAMN04489858_109138 [Paracoccus homiensis]